MGERESPAAPIGHNGCQSHWKKEKHNKPVLQQLCYGRHDCTSIKRLAIILEFITLIIDLTFEQR